MFLVSSNQLITAEKPNPAVTPPPTPLLREIWLLKTVHCLLWDDVISRLRLRHAVYDYYTFNN